MFQRHVSNDVWLFLCPPPKKQISAMRSVVFFVMLEITQIPKIQILAMRSDVFWYAGHGPNLSRLTPISLHTEFNYMLIFFKGVFKNLCFGHALCGVSLNSPPLSLSAQTYWLRRGSYKKGPLNIKCLTKTGSGFPHIYIYIYIYMAPCGYLRCGVNTVGWGMRRGLRRIYIYIYIYIYGFFNNF